MPACDQHGDWPLPAVPYPLELRACPKCRRAAAADARHYLQMRKRWQHWEFNSGLAAEEKSASFDGYRTATQSQEKALQACQHYADAVVSRGTGGIYLYGPQGTGKTHLAASVLTHACRRGLLGHYFTWSTLSEALLASFRSTSDRCLEFATTLTSPLLVVDELPSGRWKEWEIRKLEYLVNERYRHELPTMWVSNSKPESLDAITPMIESRFACRAALLMVDGPDLRTSEEYFAVHRKIEFPRPELPNIQISYPEYKRVLTESEIISYAQIP